jgi:hypothetical protein
MMLSMTPMNDCRRHDQDVTGNTRIDDGRQRTTTESHHQLCLQRTKASKGKVAAGFRGSGVAGDTALRMSTLLATVVVVIMMMVLVSVVEADNRRRPPYTEEQRQAEYVKRNHTFPFPQYNPNTEGTTLRVFFHAVLEIARPRSIIILSAMATACD